MHSAFKGNMEIGDSTSTSVKCDNLYHISLCNLFSLPVLCLDYGPESVIKWNIEGGQQG